jgi:hypothetical protein
VAPTLGALGDLWNDTSSTPVIKICTNPVGPVWTVVSGGGGGTPGGADTNVQYNNAGSFGGEAAFSYNSTTDTLSLGNTALGADKLNVFGTGGALAIFQQYGGTNGNNILATQTAAVTGSTYTVNGTSTSSDMSIIRSYNQDTSTGSAVLACLINATSSGDAYSWYGINGSSTWTTGLDNSDSDKYKIVPNGTLASGVGMALALHGDVEYTSNWNSGGTTFTGIKSNVTDTASASASMIMDLQVGGVSQFTVRKDGVVSSPFRFTAPQFMTIASDVYIANGPVISLASNGVFRWTDAASAVGGSIDTGLVRNAAGVVEVNNGTAGTLRDLRLRNIAVTGSQTTNSDFIISGDTAQLYYTSTATGWVPFSFRSYTTFTLCSGTSLTWSSGINASGGSLDLGIFRNAAGVLEVNSGTNGTYRDLLARNVRTNPSTVAGLVAAATVGAGTRAFVTDATVTTFASVVAGGGANGVPVYSDGTNWRIG